MGGEGEGEGKRRESERGQKNSGAEKEWRSKATTATTGWQVRACDTVM